MASQQAGEAVAAVSRLIAQLGVAGLVALIAEITSNDPTISCSRVSARRPRNACVTFEYSSGQRKRWGNRLVGRAGSGAR